MDNKKILLGTILLTGLLLSGVVLAVPKPVSTYDDPKGKVNGQAGKSQVIHLYLVQKDPEEWTSIIADGAWGKMTYNTKNDKIVFNEHHLDPEEGYLLINYAATAWPDGINCITTEPTMPDEDGDIHIMASYPYNELGIDATDSNSGNLHKIWLVLADDVTCGSDGAAGSMTAWNPTSYLFEYQLI